MCSSSCLSCCSLDLIQSLLFHLLQLVERKHCPMSRHLDERKLSAALLDINRLNGIAITLSDLLSRQQNSCLASVVNLKFVGPCFTFDHTSSLKVMSKS